MPDLYGDQYEGLNIHNICKHATDFVKMWGGFQHWSNFGFESENGNLVKYVHGTGDVKKQLFHNRKGRNALLCQEIDPAW